MKQIDELKTKITTAEADALQRKDIAIRARSELQLTIRPAHVADFTNLIGETDSIIQYYLQLQGYLQL